MRVVVLSAFSDSGMSEGFERDGVEFLSFCRERKGFARHFALCIVFPIKAWLYLRKEHRRGDILYSYTGNLIQRIWAGAFAGFLRMPMYYEGCEFPYTIIAEWPKVLQRIDVWLIRKCVSGVVAITPALADYYRKITKPGTKVVTIPMTVDADRFAGNPPVPDNFSFSYIAYTGAMNRTGGGVDVLVDAFSIIASEHPDLHLVLIGRGSDELRRQYESKIGADRIHCLFSGKIPVSEMPRYICNAKILAMLPLPTKQQDGCFPTKLGEYLSSGVPTVVSRVGIPARILADGENVRFVPPNDPVATADVFRDILSNYERAETVAARGRDFARRSFHYENFADELYSWYLPCKV
ncbi:MAG: glycosyltransferase family 4 protein [Kiritimatiellae bacterium]|nr:glycosyltransferase family 4 protein [Kiritimatiellia bacterium]